MAAHGRCLPTTRGERFLEHSEESRRRAEQIIVEATNNHVLLRRLQYIILGYRSHTLFSSVYVCILV